MTMGVTKGFPGGASRKEPACNARDARESDVIHGGLQSMWSQRAGCD